MHQLLSPHPNLIFDLLHPFLINSAFLLCSCPKARINAVTHLLYSIAQPVHSLQVIIFCIKIYMHIIQYVLYIYSTDTTLVSHIYFTRLCQPRKGDKGKRLEKEWIALDRWVHQTKSFFIMGIFLSILFKSRHVDGCHAWVPTKHSWQKADGGKTQEKTKSPPSPHSVSQSLPFSPQYWKAHQDLSSL